MLGPRLSPDGLSIAIYWNRFRWETGAWIPERGLWIISRKDSSQKLLLKGLMYPLKWSEDGNSIYVMDFGKTPQEILKFNINSRLTKFIYNLPPGKKATDFDIDITPDGKTIVSTIPETNSDVWMIENFDPDVE